MDRDGLTERTASPNRERREPKTERCVAKIVLALRTETAAKILEEEVDAGRYTVFGVKRRAGQAHRTADAGERGDVVREIRDSSRLNVVDIFIPPDALGKE